MTAQSRRNLLGGPMAVVLLLGTGGGDAHAAQEGERIQDNSFLIEEAYNQGPGVVQHINTFTLLGGGEWLHTFTQEWPLGGMRHQLSYTIPIQRTENTGLGDVLIHYRLQAVGDGSARLVAAPRVSLLLPTGSSRRRHGTGGAGGQLAIPVNLVLSSRFTAVLNAGTTYVPRARNTADDAAATLDVNLGASGIWSASSRADLLVETVWLSGEEVTGPGATRRREEAYLNLGVRWAFNLRGGMQIVPGVAYTVGLAPSRGEDALFLYLSVEHPFRRTTP